MEIDRALGLLMKNVKDLRGLWPDIKSDFIKGEIDQFHTEGRSGGTFGRWKRLSPKYKAWKDKNFPGRKILERTGRLKTSLIGGRGEGFVYRPSKLGLTIGSNVPYAGYHQTGTSRGLPKRKPIDLTEKQKIRWMKLTQEYIQKSAQGYLRANL